MKRLRLLAICTVAAMCSLLLTTSPVGARAGAAVPNINNANRAQVAATYQSAIEANLSIASGWNGSTDSCSAGSASDAHDAATIESINWFRSMAGLQSVTEDPAQSNAAQLTALMMHAQGTLSHYPTADWPCHTETGAKTASLSNLTLGINGVRSILGQVEDPGASNASLGHRRWLLFPELTEVGVANTTRANTVQVINDFGARYSETPWVSWPPPGFVPDKTVYPRWSMSYAGEGSVDFSNATVSVTENGRALNVEMLPIFNGFGDPTLGWEVEGANPSQAGDTVYEVAVTNFVVNGQATSRRYTVTSFDASAPIGPTCNGRQATIVGSSGDDHLVGTAGQDVIVGLGGNDVIDGLAGNDIMCGGPGNDLIRSGWGNDVVFGGNGMDTIRGARGHDVLNGGNGRDRIDGGLGSDTLIGGAHQDTLLGNLGNDTCWGRAASQSLSLGDYHACENGL